MAFFNITSIKSQSQKTSEGDPSELPVSQIEEGQLAVDVLETDKEIIVLAPIAGATSQEIRVSLSDDVLTISGSRTFPEKLSENERHFIQECYWGEFERAIVLPSIVDFDQVKAKFKEGILRVTIPKLQPANAKVIQIED